MAIVITRPQRRGIVAAASAALVVGLGVASVVDSGSEPPAEAAVDAVSTASVESELPAGAFELFDGTEASFAEFAGTPLVINFWASWCPACVAELPEFQTVHEERGDEVTFLGIANADLRPAAQALADEVGLTFTLADDPNGDLFRKFELIAMPSTLFIDANGQIVEVFGGQLNEAALTERIDKLLGDA